MSFLRRPIRRPEVAADRWLLTDSPTAPMRCRASIEKRIVHGRPELVEQDGVTVVVFGAELNSITEDRISLVSEAIMEAAEADPPYVVVDLAGVEFFSSSFIEVVFRLWNRLQRHDGGRMALCGLTQYCHEVISVTNLDDLWEIYPDRQTAIAAMRPAS